MTAPPTAASPAQIGRYVIDGTLGRGAMGVIYRAHDPDIDRPVALKLIRADLLDGEDRTGFIARFRQEAQAAGRCAHPNIVAIYDLGLHEGNPFLVMEYVDGSTLAQVQARTPRLPPGEATGIIHQVLAALGAAHALGIVHRDVKPANIMLTANQQVKVTDFGISRLDASSLTQAGSIIGTPNYMSPEQCRGEPVDGRSDLFSAAIVLFELLCGERPFPGKSSAEVWHRVVNDDPLQRPSAQFLVPALRSVLARGLAKAPAARFRQLFRARSLRVRE